ncbi:LADA_0D02058g1_1 [Lachancea dasiensis]|uniref:NADPH-dependent diflavin oxidoreductase 1 n=1 Tax=Lachancea dasiensis TaxID=1072105 RepID=A0A1G4J429_9SACH|nr:LADA_0D02058g1_1 [Lachancea dasiensis]
MGSKKIVVLYGSETGNAHEFAHVFSYQLHRFHFAHTLASLGDYAARDLLQCKHLFIICSTTGQGEMPRNVSEKTTGESKDTLWSFLKKKSLPSDFLSHIQVSMLGLGDSSYPHFNFAIRKLHKRIVDQLGAQETFPRLEADELGMTGSNGGTGTGIEAVYFEFEKRAIKSLLSKFPNRRIEGVVVERKMVPDDVFMEPEVSLNFDEEVTVNISPTFEGDPLVKHAKVIGNKRITHTDHFQDVRQFSFECNGESYEAGDTVALYPHNRDSDVAAFLDTQPHWIPFADRPLKVEGFLSQYDGGLISPLTLRNILKYHCELTSCPRKIFFMKTWMFATQKDKLEGGDEQLEQQREKLRQFAVEEDMDDLHDYCNRPRRSLLEVLRDFPSLKLPWEYMLSYLPLIKPRLFSISSKPSSKEIQLTVAIVKYKTILRQMRRGLCTDYLQTLQPADVIRYKLQSNKVIKPYMRASPIILIAPGVGIAPMMCLLKSELFKNVTLFFGNRMKSRDFLYRHELENWDESRKINLYSCFSRDPLNSPDAKYVQDLMWQKGDVLAELIMKKNAIIYLCGSSGKMPVQVRITILEIMKKWGGLEEEEAEIYLKNMERVGRYLQETW